ncbi:MAG: DNA polymerase subunit beta [Clostridiaceae bacterium BRH_c20a]|nr:MAG: DNA polymerase subunit beta [Clostridiaceae bacterium BRH_c20a]
MEKKINIITNYLKGKVSPYVIYIFGSFARGEINRESDIDIAFLSEGTFNSYDLFFYAQELASLLGRDVDLVDLNQASTVFQSKVVSKGKVIFCTDEKRRALFEMTVYKKYARLNEERKEILKGIRERGTVYG